MTTKHIKEVRKFIKVRQSMRGIDHERIISAQVGSVDEAHITASGLIAICDSHADLLEALEGLVAVIYETRGPQADLALVAAKAAIAKAKP